MKVKYVQKDDVAVDVFTIGKIYDVISQESCGSGVVCKDDDGDECVMFTHEYEVME